MAPKDTKMLSFLERQATLIDTRLVLLAPASASTVAFTRVDHDPTAHAAIVREVQRLRGAIYMGDGALQRDDLSVDGRHQTAEDDNSWHFVMLNREGRANSCVWYLAHDGATFLEELRVRACPLGRDAAWRDTFRAAVEGELARAGRDGLRFAEVGGWAVRASRAARRRVCCWPWQPTVSVDSSGGPWA